MSVATTKEETHAVVPVDLLEQVQRELAQVQKERAQLAQELALYKGAPTTDEVESFQRRFDALYESVQSSETPNVFKHFMLADLNNVFNKLKTLQDDSWGHVKAHRSEWRDAGNEAFQNLRELDSIKEDAENTAQLILEHMASLMQTIEKDDRESIVGFGKVIQKKADTLDKLIDKAMEILDELALKALGVRQKACASKQEFAEETEKVVQELRESSQWWATFKGAGKGVLQIVGCVLVVGAGGTACVATAAGGVVVAGGVASGLGTVAGGVATVVAPVLAPVLAPVGTALLAGGTALIAPVAAALAPVAAPVGTALAYTAGGVYCTAVVGYGTVALACIPLHIRETYLKERQLVIDDAERAIQANEKETAREFDGVIQEMDLSRQALKQGAQVLTSLKVDTQSAKEAAKGFQRKAEESKDLSDELKDRPQANSMRKKLEELDKSMLEYGMTLQDVAGRIGEPKRLEQLALIQENRGHVELQDSGNAIADVVPARILEEMEDQPAVEARDW